MECASKEFLESIFFRLKYEKPVPATGIERKTYKRIEMKPELKECDNDCAVI